MTGWKARSKRREVLVLCLVCFLAWLLWGEAKSSTLDVLAATLAFTFVTVVARSRLKDESSSR